MSRASSDLPARCRGEFATTRWSIVLAAKDKPSSKSRQALAKLCEQYWYPLYAFLRRRGHAEAEAQDLTQGFFTRLLEKADWGTVAPELGRFRAFLLAGLQHFAANEWDRANAQKRGGHDAILSLDFGQAESRYGREPQDGMTPQTLFEREWARSLLSTVRGQLAQEFASSGKAEYFAILEPYLTGDATESYREAAAALEMTPGAVRVAVHRMRRRFGELLRAEIAQTVQDPEVVEDEIRALLEVLRS